MRFLKGFTSKISSFQNITSKYEQGRFLIINLSLPNSVEWLGVICFPDFLPPKKDNFFYNFFLRSFSNFFFIDNVMATHWAANGEKKILKIHSQHRKNLVRPLSLNFFFFFFYKKSSNRFCGPSPV